MKGSYILFIKLNNKKNIKYGINKSNYFKKGFYIYIGSALNSLENRINRHLRLDKKIYWHIDYLLKHCKIFKIFYRESDFKDECIIANLFKEYFLSINGFGSSDCKCKTHLFFGKKEKLLDFILKNNFNEYHHQKI
jgi:endonuclease-3